MTHVTRILTLLEEGIATSSELSAETGIPQKTVIATMSYLSRAKRPRIEPCGTLREGRRGKESTMWRLTFPEFERRVLTVDRAPLFAEAQA